LHIVVAFFSCKCMFHVIAETMPFRCCVPRCKGNYPSGPKVRFQIS